VIPPELIVYDEEEACPYLPGQRARRPLRQPIRRLTGAEFDRRLEAGDRRTGPFLYTQACPACAACEPIRINVRDFVPSRAQRRAKMKGDAHVVARTGPLEVDEQRVALYLAHERARGLGRGAPIEAAGYEAFLVVSCVDGFEIRYFVEDRLAAVAITDRGERSLSAVYTYWDPAYAALSLGTYSILTQLAFAAATDLDWVYLGLAVQGSAPMAYKMGFLPHERRIGQTWRRFSRAGCPASGEAGLPEGEPRD
jgi:arginine-tRNA-protein transferase